MKKTLLSTIAAALALAGCGGTSGSSTSSSTAAATPQTQTTTATQAAAKQTTTKHKATHHKAAVHKPEPAATSATTTSAPVATATTSAPLTTHSSPPPVTTTSAPAPVVAAPKPTGSSTTQSGNQSGNKSKSKSNQGRATASPTRGTEPAPAACRRCRSWLPAVSFEVASGSSVHVTHPRYFGLFNPAPTFPAQCADRIVAVFNPQLATSSTSPAAVEIESHVIRSVACRAGLPAETVGHFTTAGSEANYTALICALTRSNAGFAAHGARCFEGPPVFYVSRESTLLGSRSRTRRV